jgi:hypothetical protein
MIRGARHPRPGKALSWRRTGETSRRLEPVLSTPRVRDTAEELAIREADPGRMQVAQRRSVRYPVAFREGDGPIATGAVEVESHGLRLTGRHQATPVEYEVSCRELTQVRLGHELRERLNGYPGVVLERTQGEPLLLAPLGIGLRAELADTLAALAGTPAGDAEKITLIVPLRRGSQERARALIAEGPPFDSAALGLVRHEVFLSATEAVFVLEGPGVQEILERALGEPRFWRAGLSWRRCAAGPPRLARLDGPPAGELVYSWVAREL